ncbi:MAG: ribosome assembly cofactor RimP [Flavobacteriales bacterium]|nr:ribosome assembly cofactor RimP [Flavobacteriales bacterium]
MMITEGSIRALVEEKIEGSDQFIVSLKVLSSNRIKVFIDALGGLNVKDCVAISRHIEGSLDREEQDFELEVSSPGLTEPYTHPLQYKKNVGRTVKLILEDGTTVKGKLTAFEETEITVDPEVKKGKKKRQETEPITVLLEQITKANTVISF